MQLQTSIQLLGKTSYAAYLKELGKRKAPSDL
jgi:hypothetical protein